MLSTEYFQYKYIPAKNKLAQEKLMIIFHGLGDSLKGFTWMPSELHLDDLSYLLVNAPDAYYGGYSWYDFASDPKPGIIRSRDLIQKLIEELLTSGLKSQNIFLFGFSQGCLMAIDAGLRTEHLLGGICGVSGYMQFTEEYPEKFSAFAKQQNFFLSHGLIDAVVPYAVSKQQYERLQALGIGLEFKTYRKEHTILPEELADIRKWLSAFLV